MGLTATFQPLSTEEFKQRLLTVHGFPEVFALSLAENLSVYRDDPEAWVEGTDFAMRDVSLFPGKWLKAQVCNFFADDFVLAGSRLEDLGGVREGGGLGCLLQDSGFCEALLSTESTYIAGTTHFNSRREAC